MKHNELVKLRSTQLDIAKHAISELSHCCQRFEAIFKNLEKVSEEIMDHCDNGDITDKTLNNKLWHNLRNVQHQIESFSQFSEDATKEFLKESMKLIQSLQDIRPPKS